MSTPLRISRLTFAAGPAEGLPQLDVAPSTVLIFVGPNNSGKSLALREIEEWCAGGTHQRKVVSEIEFVPPSDGDEALELARAFEGTPPPGQMVAPGHIWIGQHTFRAQEPVRQFQVPVDAVTNAAENGDLEQLRQMLLKLYVVRLDGRTRFTLSDPKPSGDLQQPPQNHLWALFQDDKARLTVRELTEEAFGLHFVVDPTGMTQFRIRMSESAPADLSEEQALDAKARRFHGQASMIAELSDGVQAFTGLVSAVMSLPHKVLLIDEPEAFLHPPLARRLGRSLSALATERGASLISATHSADFLIGCVESAPDTTIVRLTYEDKLATARALTASHLTELMLDPLLRSSGALRGLFHKSVVVVEADADRAFYDEVNRRLVDAGRGIEDALFVNAQNWQTIPRLLGPMRSLGIPAAAVVDLDALVEAGPWIKYYNALGLDAGTAASLEQARSSCARHLSALPRLPDQTKAYKRRGLAALGPTERAEVESHLRGLVDYGVFVVPVGELEGWLSVLGIGGPKRDWIVSMLTRLGGDSSAPDYVGSSHDDVWDFVDAIGAWTADPARKGMP